MENQLPKEVFLSQRMLANMTGTSVISTRDALKQLSHEGLLDFIPRWGYRIPKTTRTHIIEQYGLREALEVMVAYLLAVGTTEEQQTKLREYAGLCDSLHKTTSEDLSQISQTHRDLHLFMAECTGNTLLRKELGLLTIRSLRFQGRKELWTGDIEHPETWHSYLIDEILSGDSDRAQKAMHEHIQHGMNFDLRMFDDR